MELIEVSNLKKYYRKLKALDDVSFKIKEGKIYGLIGPNGAGKTTLVKLLIGGIHPTQGKVMIKGQTPDSIEVKAKLGYVSEGLALPFEETAIEYLLSIAILYKLDLKVAKNKILDYLTKFDLHNYAYAKLKKLSSGMKKKIQIIAALIADPELLILDEPTANLDPVIRYQILNLLKDESTKKNLTVIICSHNLYELEKIIDNILMIRKGKLVVEGKYQDIQEKIQNKNDTLVIKSSDNKKLLESLGNVTQFNVKEITPLTLESTDSFTIKKKLLEVAYQNKIRIEEIYEIKNTIYEVFEYYNEEKGGENTDVEV